VTIGLVAANIKAVVTRVKDILEFNRLDRNSKCTSVL
jgi:hypothetical protein